MKKVLATLTTLLLCIGAGQAQTAGLAVESFTEHTTDMDARINHPELDQNGRKCAIIKVENTNTGFSFDVGTLGVTKVVPKPGETWVYVPEGVKKITIAHPQLGILREYPIPIPVKEATVYVLKLVSGSVETVVTGPKLSTGFLIINSEPSGADLYIDKEYKGQTPFQQKYKIGEHLEWKLVMPMYHDEIGVSDIVNSKNEFTAKLRPAFGSIRVTSNPSGVKVFFDDELQSRGETPLTIEKVPSGSHKITLRKDMYGISSKQVTVNDGNCSDVQMDLVANFAELSVTSAAGAQIKINGEVKGTGSWKGNLSEGIYDIEASLAGHRTATEQVEIKKGISRSVQLAPRPVYGSVSIESEPTGASIFIDGRECGTTPDVIADLLVGNHTLKLTMKEYKDYDYLFTIKENVETPIMLPLTTTRPSGQASGNSNYTETAFGINMKMVWVEGGEFMMGGTSEQGSEAESDEQNLRRVTLDSYYIGMFEVTQGQWEKVMGTSISQQRNKKASSASLVGTGPDYPMYYVSWEEAMTFCQELSRKTGKTYTLPTEAQWEYAARGGSKPDGTKYSGSYSIDAVAWYTGNSSSATHPVGTKRANGLGIYDMSGNVWEWCLDWHDASYRTYDTKNPTGPESGSYRVLRGGGWFNNASICRVSYRGSNSPGGRYDGIGFRVAMIP